jgi:peptide chain release factor subunit 1
VASLSRDLARTLAGSKGSNGPVVTLYLDVDGSRHVRPKDYEAHLERMARAAESRNPEAAADLHRIVEHIEAGFDRSNVKGIAVFSGVADDIWEFVELPTRITNQLVVNSAPHIRQLEAVIENNERYAVLLADRQRGRMLVFELGQLVDRSEAFDALPRHEDDKGDWDKDHVRDHVAEAAHQHLKHVASVAFDVFQSTGFEHLILAGADDIVAELERCLHSYLKERVVARLPLAANASDAAIREAAAEAEEEVERAKKAELVDRLREAVGRNNGGVAELAPVLQALSEKRVDTLIVSNGFEREGWRCGSCDYLAATGPSCPVCESTMDHVSDIVEEAVEEALGQSANVEVLDDNPDIDVLGRIGALLRF